MERALEPKGYLVIGAMESLNGICPQFESKRHLRSVFYQVPDLAAELLAIEVGQGLAAVDVEVEQLQVLLPV
jgi:hypothetical protein